MAGKGIGAMESRRGVAGVSTNLRTRANDCRRLHSHAGFTEQMRSYFQFISLQLRRCSMQKLARACATRGHTPATRVRVDHKARMSLFALKRRAPAQLARAPSITCTFELFLSQPLFMAVLRDDARPRYYNLRPLLLFAYAFRRPFPFFFPLLRRDALLRPVSAGAWSTP